jgi:hypothetical protein
VPYLSEIHVGALALGVFVGYLLSFGLLQSKPSVRASVTVVGAALGATPLMFLKLNGGLWLYPVGLLLGLCSFRVVGARTAIATKISRPSRQNQVHGLFAWLDLIIIGLIAVASVVYAIVSK